MENILIGTVDRTILVFIPDPASTDGSGKTGLTHADMTVSYTRVETDNDVVVTDVTSSLTTLTNLTDAHADWGFKEVSSTLAPGLYRLDIADAVFATGAWYAAVYVMITTSAAAATPKAFQLVAIDPTAAKVPADLTHAMGTALAQPGAGTLAGGISSFYANLAGDNSSSASADWLLSIKTKTDQLTFTTANNLDCYVRGFVTTALTNPPTGNLASAFRAFFSSGTGLNASTASSDDIYLSLLDFYSLMELDGAGPAFKFTSAALADAGGGGDGITEAEMIVLLNDLVLIITPEASAQLAQANWDLLSTGTFPEDSMASVVIAGGGGGGGGGIGPGADQVTFTFTDENSDPIPDASIWITSDAAGSIMVAGSLQTDSNGQVMFMLDDGVTYYLWLRKDGVNPIMGQSFVAEED